MRLFPRAVLWFTSLLCLIVLGSCKDSGRDKNQMVKIPDQYAPPISPPNGMLWVPPRQFTMGANPSDRFALAREFPAHPVRVNGFFIDATEVTNAQFRAFTQATGYVTLAERPVNWEQLKKELPPDTEKPHDSMLEPGSVVFNTHFKKEHSDNDLAWWQWKRGAHWRQPNGPGSSLEGKDEYPVVHIAYQDALAYCSWANRRLPTEAEWEAAALGSLSRSIYTWGNEEKDIIAKANTWQGVFPIQNTPEDGYPYIAPVGSFSPNSLGIFDMSGNVWEWTSDWYDPTWYKTLLEQGIAENPTGPEVSYNPENPYALEKVIKGGSYLCNASYCASYRISARMPHAADTGTDHIGFRTVVTPDMLINTIQE